MITLVVARLKSPIYGPDGQVHQQPVLLEVDNFPEGSPLREMFNSLERMVGDRLALWVLFPGGWAGKKPKADDVSERVGNLLALHPDRSLVVCGSTVCSFFAPKLYSTYMGTCNRDFGTALFPAPHPEDLLNSDNVTLGDLVLALFKSKTENDA